MKRELRELVKKAELLGFTFAGARPGGHIALDHENGQTYFTAATGSDWRGTKNAIADLERIAGRKLPRANHRRSRKNPTADQAATDVEASRRRHRDQWDAKAAEREAARIAEESRKESAKKAAADDRRRREIEDLMR